MPVKTIEISLLSAPQAQDELPIEKEFATEIADINKLLEQYNTTQNPVLLERANILLTRLMNFVPGEREFEETRKAIKVEVAQYNAQKYAVGGVAQTVLKIEAATLQGSRDVPTLP